MQINKAYERRRAWGDRRCSHPALAKEYVRGKETGMRVCTTCGRVFTRAEADRFVADRLDHPDEEPHRSS